MVPPPPYEPYDKSRHGMTEVEFSFRGWAARQRNEYRKFQNNEKSRMNDTRIKTLADLGFEWAISGGSADREKRRIL